MIAFCPKCNKLLTPQEDKGVHFVMCPDCHIWEEINPVMFKEKLEHEDKGKGIKTKNLFATYNYKCKQCGYDKAEVSDLGAFISDEDNLIMITCGKCGYTERFGRKTS